MAIRTIDGVAKAAFAPKSLEFIAAASGSDASSSFLGIYKLCIGEGEQAVLVGSCETPGPFNRITWGDELIAGGLSAGNVEIYDPAKLIREYENQETSTAVKTLTTNPVSGLDFNPLKQSQLASSSDGVISVWNTETTTFQQEITLTSTTSTTCLQWNRLKDVILATSSVEGITEVWDVRSNKIAMTLTVPGGPKRCSALQWNPESLTSFMVAVDDPAGPVVQLWDLRNRSKPYRTLLGHSQAIHSLAWCPHDTSLGLSCGNDRTLCWDLTTNGEIVYEVPGIVYELPGEVFDVQWSPRIPGVVAASAYAEDAPNVAIHCIENWVLPNGYSRAPKWMKCSVGASTGFGGKLVTFKSVAPASKSVPPNASEVALQSLPEEHALLEPSSAFEAAIAERDQKAAMKNFSREKLAEISGDDEQIWRSLLLRFEEDGGKTLLVNELGVLPPEEPIDENVTDEPAEPAIDFFDNMDETSEVVKEEIVDFDEKMESLIVTGRIKSAVQLCIQNGKTHEAILIAAGDVLANAPGLELLKSTHEQFSESLELLKSMHEQISEKTSDSYLKLVSARANRDLKEEVESRPTSSWKNTLAFICTYASSTEYGPLAGALASKLEASDKQAAVLCYIFAGNVEKTVEILSRGLKNASNMKTFATELQALVEKCIVLYIATDRQEAGPALLGLMAKYVELLTNESRLQSAEAYLSLVPVASSPILAILQDRIKKNTQAPTRSQTISQTSAAQGRQFSRETPFSYQQDYPSRPDTAGRRHGEFTPAYHHQQFTPQPSVSQFTPQPPVSQFTPQPPVSQFAPHSPKSQFVPQPPVSQFTPQPPVSQFAPQPPKSQFVPQPPVQQFAPQPPKSQFVPQPPVQQPFVQQPPPPYQSRPESPFRPQVPQFTPQTFQPPFRPPVTEQPAQPPSPLKFNQFNPSFQPSFQPRPPIVNDYTPAAPKPLIAHLSEPAPAPVATADTADTSNVRDEWKPIVQTLSGLFNEIRQALSAVPGKAREIDDTSKRLGQLFTKLNAGDVSADAAAKLLQMCDALRTEAYEAALSIQVGMTTTHWDECGFWLTGLKRIIKARQTL